MTDSLLLRQIVRNDGAFSLLRRVNFGGCTRVTDAAIRKVLALSGKTLTHLYLEGCALLTTELVRYAATACPNLEVLDLTACASVDTLEVLRLSDEDWPRLRELELMDTGALAGRVPQETFERHAALAERRERHKEQKKAEEEAAERAAEDAFLPFGGDGLDGAATRRSHAASDDAAPSGRGGGERARRGGAGVGLRRSGGFSLGGVGARGVPPRPRAVPGRALRVRERVPRPPRCVGRGAPGGGVRPRDGGAGRDVRAQLRAEHAARLRARDLRGVRAEEPREHDPAARRGSLRVPVPRVRAGHARARWVHHHALAVISRERE